MYGILYLHVALAESTNSFKSRLDNSWRTQIPRYYFMT